MREQQIRCWTEALAGALVLAAFAGAFWYYRIVVPAHRFGFVSTDLFFHIAPMQEGLASFWRNGILPLWNPYQLAGTPFAAGGMAGAFYPLNFPYFLFRSYQAIEVVTLLHLVLGAWFLFLFCRLTGISRLGSGLAAVAWVWSAPLPASTFFPPALAANAWLPLGALATEKIFVSRGRQGIPILALAVAMPFLAGWFQTAAYALYAYAWLGLGGAVFLLGRDERRRLPKILICFAIGILGGLALAAVQLLPSLELVVRSVRSPGKLTGDILLPLGAPSVWQLVSGLFGGPGWHGPYFASGVALLALFSLSRTDRARLLFQQWGLAVGWFLFAAGNHTPFFGLAGNLPGLSWFRSPHRALVFVTLAVSVLAGLGVDSLRDARAGLSLGTRAGLAALGFGVAVLAVLGFDAPAFSSLGFALALSCFLFLPSRVTEPAIYPLAAACLLEVFLARSYPYLRPYHRPWQLRSAAHLFAFLREKQEFDRTLFQHDLEGEVATGSKQATVHRVFAVSDHEALVPSRNSRLYLLLGGPEASRRNRGPFLGGLPLAPTSPRFRLVDLLSVRFFVAIGSSKEISKALEEKGWKPVARFRRILPKRGGLIVYENPRPLPRAYVVRTPVFVADADVALRVLASPEFDPWRTAAIERTADIRGEAAARGHSMKGRATAPASYPSSGTHSLPDQHAGSIVPARIVAYAPSRVVVEAETQAPGYLVLTDTYYPGWRAAVDGKPTRIYPANVAFRAVELSPGRHEVVFEYRPWSFRAGAGISLVALVLFSAALFHGLPWGSSQRAGTGFPGMADEQGENSKGAAP